MWCMFVSFYWTFFCVRTRCTHICYFLWTHAFLNDDFLYHLLNTCFTQVWFSVSFTEHKFYSSMILCFIYWTHVLLNYDVLFHLLNTCFTLKYDFLFHLLNPCFTHVWFSVSFTEPLLYSSMIFCFIYWTHMIWACFMLW